jgi:hypothetical protein
MNPQKEIISALVQNYGFKHVLYEEMPTIDFVYPDYTADGNTEAFRFNHALRSNLLARAEIVRTQLRDSSIIRTFDINLLLEVGIIAPRLGLEEQITGKINGVYSYAPLLFAGFSERAFNTYVVKPIIDASMAWFELTNDETNNTKELLIRKAQEKPYRNFIQRLFYEMGETK